jgi:hypothetical protein
MLVWLASYPRSGNTLLRAVLKECLGLSTFSLHDDGDRRVFATPSLCEAVGHEARVEAPDVVAFELADFLGLRVTRRFSRSFAELQSLHPKFFRRGSDSANVAEMAPHKPLFDENHADVMRELGYGLG